MKTMQQKIAAVKREFERNPIRVTASQLVKYPKGTLGEQLGNYLFIENYGQNVYAEQQDALQLLIAGKNSVKDDFGLYFYLFGNGSNSLQTWGTMFIAMALCPFYLPYFYKKYKAGREANRLYDIDHLALLHQPVDRVKAAFGIK